MNSETNFNYKLKARRSKEQNIIKKKSKKRFDDFDDRDFRQDKRKRTKRKKANDDIY